MTDDLPEDLADARSMGILLALVACWFALLAVAALLSRGPVPPWMPVAWVCIIAGGIVGAEREARVYGG